MTCANCGRVSGDDARFCPGCGAALDGRQEDVDGAQRQGRGAGRAVKDESAELLGHVIEKRYRLDSKIGSGGMGTVYRATRLSIGDEVAVKVLNDEHDSDPNAAERFRREAKTAARLKHPCAVTIHEFGVSYDGLMYIAMELVEGQSLRHVIRERGSLPVTVATEVTTQVCAALDEAHRLGIVHRDIKPDNILLQDSPAGLRVKVLDFGIAKLRDMAQSNITQTGSTMGTPRYMSPEQCMGQEVDARSDIYSTGIVIFEMLCGVTPFNSPTSSAIYVQQATQPPPPLCTLNASITPAVEYVVLRALEKRPEDRPQTAGELASELSSAVYGPSGPRRAAVMTSPLSPQPTSPQNSGAGPGATPTMQVSHPASGARSAGRVSGPLFPSGVNRTGTVRRNYAPLILGAIFLAVFAATAFGVGAWYYSRRDDSKPDTTASQQPPVVANTADGARAVPTKQVNAAALRNTPQPAPTPAAPASSADDEISALREQVNDLRRQGKLSKSDSPEVRQVAASVEDADRRYRQTDFHFLYEGAKLYVDTREHHESFEMLFRAAREAIQANKSDEMLSMMEKDGGEGGAFHRMTINHPEWNTLYTALQKGNASLLVSGESHHHHH